MQQNWVTVGFKGQDALTGVSKLLTKRQTGGYPGLQKLIFLVSSLAFKDKSP